MVGALSQLKQIWTVMHHVGWIIYGRTVGQLILCFKLLRYPKSCSESLRVAISNRPKSNIVSWTRRCRQHPNNINQLKINQGPNLRSEPTNTSPGFHRGSKLSPCWSKTSSKYRSRTRTRKRAWWCPQYKLTSQEPSAVAGSWARRILGKSAKSNYMNASASLIPIASHGILRKHKVAKPSCTLQNLPVHIWFPWWSASEPKTNNCNNTHRIGRSSRGAQLCRVSTLWDRPCRKTPTHSPSTPGPWAPRGACHVGPVTMGQQWRSSWGRCVSNKSAKLIFKVFLAYTAGADLLRLCSFVILTGGPARTIGTSMMRYVLKAIILSQAKSLKLESASRKREFRNQKHVYWEMFRQNVNLCVESTPKEPFPWRHQHLSVWLIQHSNIVISIYHHLPLNYHLPKSSPAGQHEQHQGDLRKQGESAMISLRETLEMCQTKRVFPLPNVHIFHNPRVGGC